MGFGLESDKEDDEEVEESAHSREQSVVEETMEVSGSSAAATQHSQLMQLDL